MGDFDRRTSVRFDLRAARVMRVDTLDYFEPISYGVVPLGDDWVWCHMSVRWEEPRANMPLLLALFDPSEGIYFQGDGARSLSLAAPRLEAGERATFDLPFLAASSACPPSVARNPEAPLA